MTELNGLDLVNRMPEQLWTEVLNILQEAVNKTKEKCKNAKWFSEEALQIAEERSAKQGKKGKVHPTNAESQRTASREKRAFFNEQCEEIEENNRKDKRSLQESWKY